MSYLAIDFGTANCVAAYSKDGETHLVPLEGDLPYLPSVVFAPRIEPARFEFDYALYEREFARAKRDDQARVARERKDFDLRLERFVGINGPQIGLPPKRQDFTSLKDFERARDDYAYKRQQYLRDLEVFRSTRLAEEIQNLSRFLRPALTDVELDRAVRATLVRDMGEERNREYWEQTSMSVLKKKGSTCLFGTDAIRAYSADPLGGFFMRSPKAFLGTSLSPEWRSFFTQLISRILLHIKARAEEAAGLAFDGVLFGRPVNYQSANDRGNDQAVSIMRDAAQLAGFTKSRFVFEPLAASMEIDRSELLSFQDFMVIDIGGGTTDVVVLSIDRNHEFNVRGTSGRRVGGNDFDESIAWGLFTPLLGRGSEMTGHLKVPGQIYQDAIATRDVPAQLRFRNAGHRIEDLMLEACNPKLIKRFLRVWDHQLQHQLVSSGEEAKIGLSTYSPSTVSLEYVEKKLKASLSSEEFVSVNRLNLDRILSVARDCLIAARSTGPLLTFVTGGLSYSRDTMLFLKAGLPEGTQLALLPALNSVCAGLGTIAGRLSKYEEHSEPGEILGIPVFS